MQIEYNEVTIVLPKPPSLNKWYSGKHWAVRKKQKEIAEEKKQKERAEKFKKAFNLDKKENEKSV